MDPNSPSNKPQSDNKTPPEGSQGGVEGAQAQNIPSASPSAGDGSSPSAPVGQQPASVTEQGPDDGSSLGQATVPSTPKDEKEPDSARQPAKPSPMTNTSPTGSSSPSLADEAAEVLRKEDSKVIDVTKAPPPENGNKESGDVTIIPRKKKSKIQYIIAIVLFILAIGGVVFLAMMYFSPRADQEPDPQEQLIGPTPTITMEPTPVVEAHEPLPALEDSDEVDTIESDLDATDITDLDTDLSTLDDELSN